MISPLLSEIATYEFHIFAEKLMSDALFPFAKTNVNMTSARKRGSLSQELHGSPLRLAASFFPQN
jgi:hypothetical protein